MFKLQAAKNFLHRKSLAGIVFLILFSYPSSSTPFLFILNIDSSVTTFILGSLAKGATLCLQLLWISSSKDKREKIRIMTFLEGLNVINDPKCNKVINVITMCPNCNKLFSCKLH